jgi:hypothetical protein
VPGGDALECPAVRREDDLLGEELRLLAGLVLRYLDDDLVDGSLVNTPTLTRISRPASSCSRTRSEMAGSSNNGFMP